MSFSTPALILAQIFTSSSINTQVPSYRSALVNYFPSWVYSVTSNCYTCLEFMVLLASQFICLEWQYIVVVISRIYLPSSLSNNLTAALVSPLIYRSWQSYDLTHTLHVLFCWGIGRTIWYKALPLFTYCMNSWWRFSSTRYCTPIWLKGKRLTLVTGSWCHMNITHYLTYFNLFQSATFYGCNVYWKQWNKG